MGIKGAIVALTILMASALMLSACASNQATSQTEEESVLENQTSGVKEESVSDQQLATDLTDQEVSEDMSESVFSDFPNVTVIGANYSVMSEDEVAVLYRYAQYSQAMTEPDMVTLGEIISDDVTFTHMSGTTQTKSEYLDDIEQGLLDYQAVDIKDPVVMIDGEVATITSTTVLTARAYGAQGSWPFKGTRWFQQREGIWYVINAPE